MINDLYIWFVAQHAVLQALLAGLFTWGLTASGAALVVFFNKTNRKLLVTSIPRY
jgi:ZIP family zinc transporter